LLTDMSGTLSSDTYMGALSSLLESGKRIPFDPSRTRYACHTSTIPLATTFDENTILEESGHDDLEIRHSTLHLSPELKALVDYRCCKKHCMYVSQSGFSSTPEFIRASCPCDQIRYEEFLPGENDTIEVGLQPLCFLQVLKELRYQFGYADKSTDHCETDDDCCHNTRPRGPRLPSTRPQIDFSEVMFCQNSQGVLDQRYSRPLRDLVHVSGWESVTHGSQVHKIFEYLYWYRRWGSQPLKNCIQKHRSKKDFYVFKAALQQTFHTMNGFLVKLFLCFPCEMQGYASVAKHTAELFQAILFDYLKVSDTKCSGQNSIFLFAKEMFKIVKETLHSSNIERRYTIFELFLSGSRSNPFLRFFAPSLKRLQKRILGMHSDYTTSVAWLTSMTQFSQTRNMGYLPPWVATIKRQEFRDTIMRPKIIVSPEQLTHIRQVVKRRQAEMGLPPHILKTERPENIFKEAILALKIPLKPSASVAHTVREGGKVEDARALLDRGIERKWKIPMRDFATGRITDYLEFHDGLRTEKPTYESYLFWTALTIVLNALIVKEPDVAAKLGLQRYELPGSENFEEDVFMMSIVHISEPAKERNLTKSSALLGWVLTVTSKVSQSILAWNQDHRAGLILSAQDWMHQRRVSHESPESAFIYDQATGLRNADIWNGFQDWTESTDYIPRIVGGVSLMSWLQYMGFPGWFAKVTLSLAAMDYTVDEIIATSWQEGELIRNRYRGQVTEGFMMGNALTKTILHLMHDINVGTVHHYMRSLGIEVLGLDELVQESRVEFRDDGLKLIVP